VYTSH